MAISFGSTSTIAFLAFGAKYPGLYAVWPKSNLAPILSTKSEFCCEKFAPLCPTRPGLPIYKGWLSSKKSIAFQVVNTGIFNISANCKKSLTDFDNLIPLPAKITGRFAKFKSFIMSVTDCFVFMPTFSGSTHPFKTSGIICADCTSNGMSIHTGPGLPLVASYNAFSRCTFIISGLLTLTTYFVIGLTMAAISTS